MNQPRDAAGRFTSGAASGTLLDTLVIRLQGDGTGYQKMMHGVETTFERTANRLNRWGKAMSLAVTGPISAVGAISTREFMKFDHAMTQSLAIMDGVTDQMQAKMAATARNISKNSITPAHELAESYFFLASAGFSAEQSVASLARVQKFAQAGAFDMALATDLLTDAQTAMGMSSKDAGQNMLNLARISDVFVRANELSNTSVRQIAEAMTADAATAARQYGASLETTTAVLNAYASAGKKASEAGNLFGRAVRLLMKATRTHAEGFQKLGIATTDAQGNYLNLIDVIGNMEQAFAGMSGVQREAALAQLGFRALAQKSITPLLGLSQSMREYESQLLNAGGATERVANKQLKSFTNQAMITKNALRDIAIDIGQILSPRLTKLNNMLRSAAAYWDTLNVAQKEQIILYASIAAAIGPVMIASSMLIRSLTTLVGAIRWVGAAALSVFGWWTIPILAVAGAIVGLVYSILGPEGIAQAWEKLKKIGQHIWGILVGLVQDFSATVQEIVETLTGPGGFQIAWEYVGAAAKGVIDFIGRGIRGALAWIRKITMALIGSDGFQAAWKWIKQTASDAFITIYGFLANLTHNFKAIMQWLPNNWGNVFRALGQIFWNWVANSIENTMTMLGTFVRLWVAFQGWLVGRFKAMFSIEFVKAVANGIIEAAKLFAKFVAQIWEWVKNAFSGRKVEMGDFVKQLTKDFQAGMDNANFFEVAGDILKDQSKKLKLNPFQGVQEILTENGAPDLRFKLPTEEAFAAQNKVQDFARRNSAKAVQGFQNATEQAGGLVQQGAQFAVDRTEWLRDREQREAVQEEVAKMSLDKLDRIEKHLARIHGEEF